MNMEPQDTSGSRILYMSVLRFISFSEINFPSETKDDHNVKNQKKHKCLTHSDKNKTDWCGVCQACISRKNVTQRKHQINHEKIRTKAILTQMILQKGAPLNTVVVDRDMACL